MGYGEMHRVYSCGSYSQEISASYGSDRAVQCYGVATIWYALLGKKEKVESLTDYVLNNLLPQLDLKAVHNTFMLLFPVLCTMKRRGMFQEARHVFSVNITEKFKQHFGEGKFSPHMESATRQLGRDGTGTVAEICYLLAKSDLLYNINVAKRLELI